MDVALVLQLLTAAGIGGVITQWLSRSGERRQARAAVRTALADVEDQRWARSTDEADGQRFIEALRGFTTAAMVAGLPRSLTESYAYVASASRAITKDRLERGNQPLHIELRVSEHIEAHAELVAGYLWHPLWGQLHYRRRLSALDKEQKALARDTNRPDAVWLGRLYRTV